MCFAGGDLDLNLYRDTSHALLLAQASAFVLFPDLYSACDSVRHLKASGVASAVEICDYASLRCASMCNSTYKQYTSQTKLLLSSDSQSARTPQEVSSTRVSCSGGHQQGLNSMQACHMSLLSC
jgi:hypothetical protein